MFKKKHDSNLELLRIQIIMETFCRMFRSGNLINFETPTLLSIINRGNIRVLYKEN